MKLTKDVAVQTVVEMLTDEMVIIIEKEKLGCEKVLEMLGYEVSARGIDKLIEAKNIKKDY